MSETRKIQSLEDIRFGTDGLAPVIVQDAKSQRVLTLAYANREALNLTLSTGESHFYSRSRNELWHKGATSGNTQRVLGIYVDCDADALLYKVALSGPACHTGAESCFFQGIFAVSDTDDDDFDDDGDFDDEEETEADADEENKSVADDIDARLNAAGVNALLQNGPQALRHAKHIDKRTERDKPAS